MWVTITSLCVIAFVAGVRSDCQDWLPNCDLLGDQYCLAPYDELAKEACAKRCGYCDDNSSVNKRAHNSHNELWPEHCWDHAPNHILDPFCALLTTTTPRPTTTPTTTEPTTTTAPTTTTPEPTTTTAEPTTTEPTTTTTEPPTTTTTEPPTTTTEPQTTTTESQTTRSCDFEEYNATDINKTDFGSDLVLVENSTLSLNKSVHLIGDLDACFNMCNQSSLEEYECWAFTYNDLDRCFLYYFDQPLNVVDTSTDNDNATTTLYLKRCSDDPTTTAPPVTESPSTIEPIATTESPINSNDNSTQGNVNTTTSEVVTTPAGINLGPDVNQRPAGGIKSISETSFEITGVPSPYPDTCYFVNATWKLNEHWTDTCRYDCECVDTTTNTALCSDTCPTYLNHSSDCSIVKVAGQCCPQLDCRNETDTNSTVAPITDTTCDDTIPVCDYYPDSACLPPYEPWARAHCSLRCGFCDYAQPCEDRITFCDRYDLDDACVTYSGWARFYCKKSCAICT